MAAAFIWSGSFGRFGSWIFGLRAARLPILQTPAVLGVRFFTVLCGCKKVRRQRKLTSRVLLVAAKIVQNRLKTVLYTHLTLPTNREV